jgi:Ran GTPase-activating protein (RanGAP) involved in mRNA processing and transport
VRELLHSPHLAALKELHLRASDLGDEGCAEIVRSGILKRLEVLDLRFGRVTDTGARALAECPDVRRLRRLTLEDNQLTNAGQALLRGLGIEVRCERQMEVGSDEYLYSGDME